MTTGSVLIKNLGFRICPILNLNLKVNKGCTVSSNQTFYLLSIYMKKLTYFKEEKQEINKINILDTKVVVRVKN